MLVAAYLAGRQAAAVVFTPGMAHATVLDHWNLALIVTVYFVILSVGRLAAARTGRLTSTQLRSLLAAVGTAGFVGLLIVADHGGQLVYRWGVGVAAR